MEEYPTVEELENRWKNVLNITRDAVNRYPDQYHALKSLAHEIVTKPLDIKEYLPTVRKLSAILNAMDPSGKGSIFYLFSDRFSPDSVWQVPLLRMECTDLLEHLNAFDRWRREIHGIKRVK